MGNDRSGGSLCDSGCGRLSSTPVQINLPHLASWPLRPRDLKTNKFCGLGNAGTYFYAPRPTPRATGVSCVRVCLFTPGQ